MSKIGDLVINYAERHNISTTEVLEKGANNERNSDA